MPRIDWIYRNDGGSDAYLGGAYIATLSEVGGAFSIVWRNGTALTFENSRAAREHVYAAAESPPWSEDGRPEV